MALNELKKQMVIKLGITTNEDAQAISGMVDNAGGGGGSMLITPEYFDGDVLINIEGSSANYYTVATMDNMADFARAIDAGTPLQPVFAEDVGESGKSYFFAQSVQTTVTEQISTRDLPTTGDYYYLEAGVKLYKIEDDYFIPSFDLIKEGHSGN